MFSKFRVLFYSFVWQYVCIDLNYVHNVCLNLPSMNRKVQNVPFGSRRCYRIGYTDIKFWEYINSFNVFYNNNVSVERIIFYISCAALRSLTKCADSRPIVYDCPDFNIFSMSCMHDCLQTIPRCVIYSMLDTFTSYFK